MRIYIAAPRAEYAVARHLARDLNEAGHTIVSTWHTLADLDGADETTDPAHRRELLERCIGDIAQADVLVAWTAQGMPRATIGEIVEMLRRHRRPVIWIQGPRGEGGNIWDADPLVLVIRHDSSTATVDTVLEVLRALADKFAGDTQCSAVRRGHCCEERGAHTEHTAFIEGCGTLRWQSEERAG